MTDADELQSTDDQCENRAMRMMMGMGTPRKSNSSERMSISGSKVRRGLVGGRQMSQPGSRQRHQPEGRRRATGRRRRMLP